jgi:hypothetical protein
MRFHFLIDVNNKRLLRKRFWFQKYVRVCVFEIEDLLSLTHTPWCIKSLQFKNYKGFNHAKRTINK